METKWIFEPHNLYGTDDPDGLPYPVGYISEGIGQPVFELRDVVRHLGGDALVAARLIAAAPELYEALAALRANIGAASLARNNFGKQLRENADAALAKARGK